MLPKVSIQIPTYNQANIIDKAIQSCLMQDYGHLEIIIADDKSTDNTSHVVSKYLSDKRIKYYVNENNLGRTGNYRKALYEYVTGSWVINLDGDDFFTDPNFISGAVALLQKHRDDDICLLMHQNPFTSNISGRQYNNGTYNYVIVNGIQYLERYASYPHFLHLGCMYKRDVAITKNFYNTTDLNSDFLSIMRLADKGNFLISSQNVGFWNLNEQSASYAPRKMQQVKLSDAEAEMVHRLHTSSNKKKQIRKQLLFINNFYYYSDGNEPKIKSIIQLLKYPKLKPFYIKALVKTLLR